MMDTRKQKINADMVPLIFLLQGSICEMKSQDGCLLNVIKRYIFDHILNKMASSAFHAHYSNIPLFHHSIWPSEENRRQKNHNYIML